MPKDEEQLTAFYAAAGYKFPTSIPRTYLTLSPRPSSYFLAPPENLTNTEMAATSTPTASSGPHPTQSTAASNGLAPGAKAGIAIGITLSVVLCTVCVLLLHLRRRRRRRQLQLQLQQELHLQQLKQQQHQQQQYERDTPKELASSQTTSTQGYRTELEGTPVASEMEDSRNTREVHEK